MGPKNKKNKNRKSFVGEEQPDGQPQDNSVTEEVSGIEPPAEEAKQEEGMEGVNENAETEVKKEETTGENKDPQTNDDTLKEEEGRLQREKEEQEEAARKE
eukprot:CAMPEP_0170519164 /NCGR_PEP_ID=MMETSP0209-20121228/4674_1 /TAXON_ID=665100 ORGANISM="Litonotus pictus, Strain P1" /NCGR_SAMPLE_ID=MMETSP0209 /ASSEMBLY_ACC=CAM_ASM_000301 /LENGTH=100 /DNA_ID=CAMNT_0010804981 /DNA_START=18 /DNA_END=317 /DNA_ORIENTATION=+